MWQKTLTINVRGLASIPNVTPNPFSASSAPVIFEGTVNEVPGSNVDLVISVGNRADPRYGTGVQACTLLGAACPLLMGNPLSNPDVCSSACSGMQIIASLTFQLEGCPLEAVGSCCYEMINTNPQEAASTQLSLGEFMLLCPEPQLHDLNQHSTMMPAHHVGPIF